MTQKTRREKITDERLQELRAMPYSDYLKTPEWYRKRAVALKLAEGRCALCNSPDTLNVHHRTYTRDGVSILGEEKMADLTVLCKSCHQTFHERRLLHREPRKAEATSTIGTCLSAPPRKQKFVMPPLPDVTWEVGEVAIHPMFGECLILAVDLPEYVIAQFKALPDEPKKMLALRFAKLRKAVAA